MSKPLPSRSSSPLLFWALFLLIIVMVAMVFLALRSFVGENNPEGKDMISNAPGPKSEKSIPENLSKEVEKNMQSTSGFVREMITKDDADGVWVKLVSAPESNAEKASSSVESLFYVQESTEGFDELRSGVFVTILHFENASSKEYVYGDAVIPSGEKKETVSQ